MTKPTQIHNVMVRSRYVNIMVYGINGIGKSPFAGGAPKTLVLECGGRETDTMASLRQEVDVWAIANRSAMWEAYEYLRHEGHKEYDWVWVDSLTGYEKLYMNEELDTAMAKRSAQNKNADRVADLREYLLVQTEIKRITQHLADLPMHFGATATVMMLPWRDLDPEGGYERETLMMMPAIQGKDGKVAMDVCGEFNVVGFLDRLEEGEEMIPAMLVRYDGRHVARDRFVAIPTTENGWLLNPTLPKIMEAIEKKHRASRVAGATKATAAKKVHRSVKKVAKKSTAVQKRS